MLLLDDDEKEGEMMKQVKFPWQYFNVYQRNKALGMLCLIAISHTAPVFAAPAANATITVKVTVRAGTCSLNNNQPIYLNFGNSINTEELGPKQYMQQLRYSVDCPNATKPAMNIQVRGTGSSFDTNVLETSNPNLGIEFYRDSNNAEMKLNTWYDLKYPTLLRIDASPVTDDYSKLTAGAFTASAALVVQYE